MSGKVVDLRPAKSDPHCSGKARCLSCQHEWVAVAPVGDIALTCPSCNLNRGEFVGSIELPGAHWYCRCGCGVFRINPDGIYCPNCGLEQRPWA